MIRPAPNLVVLDCDGVLLDSVGAKTAAFTEWVESRYPDYAGAFVQYHLGAYGQSRFVQLRYFFDQIFERPLSERELNAEIERFAAINRENMASVNMREGVQAFLEACHAASVRVDVLSGTPQSELEHTLRAHGLAEAFHTVIGSPTKKPDGLSHLLAETRIHPSHAWFVGDATADASAAASVGIPFVYVPSQAYMTLEPDLTVEHLGELIPLLHV